MTKFAIKVGDVTLVPSDLLILKHAQGFYGADEVVALRLNSANLCTWNDLKLAPNESLFVDSFGAIAPKRVLFLGTVHLDLFEYKEMYLFALQAIESIAEEGRMCTLRLDTPGDEEFPLYSSLRRMNSYTSMLALTVASFMVGLQLSRRSWRN